MSANERVLEQQPSPIFVEKTDQQASLHLAVALRPERHLPQIYVPPNGRSGLMRFWVTTILLLLLLACGLFSWHVNGFDSWLLSHDTPHVTIVPQVRVVDVQLSRTVPLRLVQASNTRQSTVATTGTVQREALAAHGTITLYSSELQDIQLDAGTSIPTSSGMSIIFDEPVLVHHINTSASLMGISTVSAHVDTVGVQGNLAAYTLKNEPCCGKQDILASNLTPFTGGQDAQDYHVVTNADVAQATSEIVDDLTTSARTALLGQLSPGEQLVPFTQACTPVLHPDHAVGSRSDQVTVMGQVTCHGEAYSYSTRTADADTTRMALRQPAFSSPFRLTESTVMSVRVSALNSKTANTILLLVIARERWLYQWDTQRVRQLARDLANLSVNKAQQFLKQTDGVQVESIQQSFWGGDRLSSDPNQIRITILEQEQK